MAEYTLVADKTGELRMDGKRYDALPAWDVIGLGIAQVPEGRRLFPRLTTPTFQDVAEPSPFGAPGPTSYRQKSGNVVDGRPRIRSPSV